MKIALICTEKLPVPPIIGGAVQIYINGILPYLSAKHDITVFCVEHPDLAEDETVDNVRYIRVGAKTITEYLNNIKENLTGFDWVHVFNRPVWVPNLGKDLKDTKFSLSLHNEMFHKEKISPTLASECIERVEFINTVSQFIADGVVKLYPQAKGKIVPIYAGINPDEYHTVWSEQGILNKEKLKEKFNLTDYKVVLSVGRLSVKKGIHILIKAMKEVMDIYDDVALVVVGSKWFGSNNEDEYTRYLKKLSESLNGPIIFTGFLKPQIIPSYYNIGDVFVCTSQWNEPLARIHYEAMGAGLPIITTNRGGNAEVVSGLGNGIVLDDYNNPNLLADTIGYILENPKAAAKMGAEGRKLAQDKYNWERVADELLQRFGDI